MTPPAASSNSAATVDLKSTDSVAAAQRHEDPIIVVDRSFPMATASGAGAIPAVPSSGAPGGEVPEVKPTELGPPYFCRLDLAAEDKVRAFDFVSTMVGIFVPCLFLRLSLGARQCSRWE